ncbi:MAG: hypothetical protein AAFN65_08600 [Bacteroidota bacterium]
MNSRDLLIGGPSGNVLSAGMGDDFLFGAGGDDTLEGGAGDDILEGGADNDTILGGDGTDTAKYSSKVDDYKFSTSDDGKTVTIAGPDGTDTLTDVEFGEFADKKVPLLGNKLSFVNDFASATFPDRTYDFELKREGDISFPVTIFVDGTIVRGDSGFRDSSVTLGAESSSTFSVRQNGFPFGDVRTVYNISIQDDNPLAGLILIEDDGVSGLFITGRRRRRGGYGVTHT